MAEPSYSGNCIYHMTHFENLISIFQSGALLSKQLSSSRHIIHRSIAMDEVQSLRDRIFFWDYATHSFKNLHSYVPFYFTVRSVMLYKKYREGIQGDIVIFEIDDSILDENGTVFTDGNASTQKLSKSVAEVVEIMPAIFDKKCQRRYIRSDSRLHQIDESCSDFYASKVLLPKLDWTIINGSDFSEPEKKRKTCAEILVPNVVPLEKIIGIAVNNQAMVWKINAFISKQSLERRVPLATLKSSLFF